LLLLRRELRKFPRAKQFSRWTWTETEVGDEEAASDSAFGQCKHKTRTRMRENLLVTRKSLVWFFFPRVFH
jgi:hypothetical protein